MKIGFIALSLFLAATAFGESQMQRTGGRGKNCSSKRLTCDNGRVISCVARLEHTGEVATSCVSQWGTEPEDGWVVCETYDRRGRVLSSFSNHCQ